MPDQRSDAPAAGRLVLVHWRVDERDALVKRLAATGYGIEAVSEESTAVLSSFKRKLPAALVIDLARLPSHGAQVAQAVREQRSLCALPIVFLNGEDAAVARARRTVPDACFASWRGIKAALARSVTSGRTARRAPASISPSAVAAGYSGTPLPRKLGIKPGARVALDGSPARFEDVLTPLPEGAIVSSKVSAKTDLVVLFTSSRAGCDRALAVMRPVLERGGGAWIAWPKKASGMASEIDENAVRDMAIARGLVDIKVCAIDATWSGLRIAMRRQSR